MVDLIFALFAVWLIGSLVNLHCLDKHYDNHISKPWKDAIRAEDWAACDIHGKRASKYLEDFWPNTFYPWRWFRHLP